MELVNNNFEEIKKTKDPEIINDFLLKLSVNPNEDYLEYINYFINNLDSQIFDRVKLNLTYLLGEIGKSAILNEQYTNFLIESYYTSDRWVRNEIIQAFGKLATKSELTEDILKLVGYAINDDYTPIKANALQVILNLKEMPLNISRQIFRALNLKFSELETICLKILEKFLPDHNQLIDSLNYSANYKILKPYTIRSLLMLYFRSPLNIESFRQKISNSDWEIEYKQKYLKEIDTYERILLKSI